MSKFKDKKYKPKPPVTRLLKSRCDLPDGRSFVIITDLPEKDFDVIAKEYLNFSKKPSAIGFIMAVKFVHPNCICVTEEQFNEMGANKYIGNATKEEWENENN